MFLILGCCTINTTYDKQPTNCQCKKFDRLVGKSIEQPNTGEHFYKIVDIQMIELRDLINQNKNCWIGKSYDYVRKVLPSPIKEINGSSYLYTAIENVNCKRDSCKYLQFSFDDYTEDKDVINNIDVARGEFSSDDWIIRLHTVK